MNERNPEDKKNRIINSAIKLFAENGYNGTSTARIAAEAGVSQGIIFHYFTSKEGLFWTMLQDKAGIYEKRLQAAIKDETDALKKIETALLGFARLIREEEGFYEVVIKQIRGSGLNLENMGKYGVLQFPELLSGLLREAMEQGSVREIDPEIAATSFFGMIDFNAFRWFVQGRNYSLDDTARQIVDLFLNGIAKKMD